MRKNVKDRKVNFSSYQVHNDNELIMSPNWQLNRRFVGFCMFPGFALLDDIQEDFERHVSNTSHLFFWSTALTAPQRKIDC